MGYEKLKMIYRNLYFSESLWYIGYGKNTEKTWNPLWDRPFFTTFEKAYTLEFSSSARKRPSRSPKTGFQKAYTLEFEGNRGPKVAKKRSALGEFLSICFFFLTKILRRLRPPISGSEIYIIHESVHQDWVQLCSFFKKSAFLGKKHYSPNINSRGFVPGTSRPQKRDQNAI